MKRTRICDLLGIEYPIIQGGMTWIANAELAAAVSNAGALGIVSPNAGMKLEGNVVEHLRSQIRKAQSLTDRPFGVNLPLQIPEIKELIDVLMAEGVKVVTTSAGSPALYTGVLKEGGVKVLQVVASVRHALSAERHGVDAVVAEGYEAGGHNGFDELPTMVLVPQVVDAVSIPVVAAGGIADARGFVAALALGAEGVQMGTCFVTTKECVAHQNFKDGIVNASDTGTVITGRKLGPARILKNEFASKILAGWERCEGFYITTAHAYADAFPAADPVKEEYERRYDAPFGAPQFFMANILYVYTQALQRAGTVDDVDRIIETLETQTFDSLCGPVFFGLEELNGIGHVCIWPVPIFRVVGENEYEIITRYTAEEVEALTLEIYGK